MIFIVLNHPISLGLVLIAHTLLISVVTGVVGGHFWFSYILFLVFLGGVLVLFIYITSLASNEKFTFDWIGLLTLTLVVGIAIIGVLLGLLPSSEAPPIVAD
jgi:NADH-ubiquinone oxidoreductase chain 6